VARFESANTIINRAALQVGLVPSTDPVASTDESYIQLVGLLNSVGQELVEMHPWQILEKNFSLTTQNGDSGDYDLPDDFSYMIDQTGWDRTNRVRIGGPLSPQDWSYLEGRDLVSQSIYASFRLVEAKFSIYPQPPPIGLEINFKYINRNWCQATGSMEPQDVILQGSDIVLYEPVLAVKFLKAQFLEAKGFDSTSARAEFENMFLSRTGKDVGAEIINAGNRGAGIPFLNGFYSVPDTGYGL
jgi:hypothetical protein